MRGWYPMPESRSEDMARGGCWALILLPLAGIVICLAVILLNTGGIG